MKPAEYFQLVVETIATHGHRDNDHFKSAFSIAQQALAARFSDEVMLYESMRVRDQLTEGRLTYRPGCDWYDPRTSAQYEFLELSEVSLKEKEAV